MDVNKHMTPVFIVYVDGKRLDVEHEGALRRITVSDCLNGISSFSLIFETGDVKIWEKGIMSLESEVSIHLGYKDDVDEVFYGEITGVRGIFTANATEELEVIGHNVLHRLNHVQHCRSYEEKTASKVIKGILDGYGLKAEVDDFGADHAFQSEENRSDLEYIMELAEAYGKQVYASGSTVYVKSEITIRNDEVIYEWGKSLINLKAIQDITHVASENSNIGWDELKGEPFTGKAVMKDLPVKIEGSKDWTDVSKVGSGLFSGTKMDLSLKDTDDAKKIALGKLQTNSYSFGFAEGKGEGNYKLRPGVRVTVKMVGEAFEGEYMANAVTHVFDRRSGYTTEFTLKRNMCT